MAHYWRTDNCTAPKPHPTPTPCSPEVKAICKVIASKYGIFYVVPTERMLLNHYVTLLNNVMLLHKNDVPFFFLFPIKDI